MSIGRIPILDVQPRVLDGARPAKAVPGEQFTVTATVFREGHDAVAANVVLTGPDGERGPWTPMRELTPGTDRYGAQVAPDRRGEWTFHVEAWSDPIATWYHAARVKIPVGIDVELVFEEGARLLERAAGTEPVTGPRASTAKAARDIRNRQEMDGAGTAAGTAEGVDSGARGGAVRSADVAASVARRFVSATVGAAEGAVLTALRQQAAGAARSEESGVENEKLRAGGLTAGQVDPTRPVSPANEARPAGAVDSARSADGVDAGDPGRPAGAARTADAVDADDPAHTTSAVDSARSTDAVDAGDPGRPTSASGAARPAGAVDADDAADGDDLARPASAVDADDLARLAGAARVAGADDLVRPAGAASVAGADDLARPAGAAGAEGLARPTGSAGHAGLTSSADDARLASSVEVDDPAVVLLLATARLLRDSGVPAEARLAAVEGARVHEALAARPVRDLVTESERCPLRVDRARALFGSWYEMFPRSEGAQVDPTGVTPPVSGTLRTAAERLPGIAAMGFDVVYLPPIHPIGTAYRKGPNNSTVAGPLDVGSPWAIGSPDGGHDAIDPALGGFADFDHFVRRAGQLGMEIALDFALQCSPDHPWVLKHPDWFAHRLDGTIAYAENPPKKYQDIYPLDFDGPGVLPAILEECERVLRVWMGHGVRIFRVDNPHTKPVLFWERLLDRIHATDPDVLFLAEAFTRPAMMHTLAKIGFHQSYTYFTWRNTKQELLDYLGELAGSSSPFLRPNLFVNTPDILHAYLQESGRPGFKIRAVLAATLSPTWGVYSGYELCENVPVRPGSEEYLDSEKYQLRPRDWAAAEAEGRSLAPFLARLNAVRREHVALQGLRNLQFHYADNDAVLCYSKRTAADLVLVVVNLDPHRTVEATVSLDPSALGLGWDDRFTVRDELTGDVFQWGRDNYIRLDPHAQPAHLLTILH